MTVGRRLIRKLLFSSVETASVSRITRTAISSWQDLAIDGVSVFGVMGCLTFAIGRATLRYLAELSGFLAEGQL